MTLRQTALHVWKTRKSTVTKSEIVAVVSAIAAIGSYVATQRQVGVARAALDFQKEQFAVQRREDHQKAMDQLQDDLRHERQHRDEIQSALRQSDRNSTAAEKSVGVARSSLGLQKEQFQEAQRAWVVFKGISIGRKLELNKPGLFLTTLSNQSPGVAISLQAEGMVKIGPPVTREDLESVERHSYSGARADLGQHVEEQVASDSIPITTSLLNEISDGRSTITYYGKYRYSDQFGALHEDFWCAYFIYNALVDQFGQANCKVSVRSPRR